MAGRPQPRRITLGGREAVALTVEEYERLIASRRQIGGQSARVRVLAQQAKRTEQLVRELETMVEDVPACRERAGEDDTDAGCLRCALADLLRRHRDLAV
ncbi:hypothetical protein ABZX85_48675 [Streptomyces sp. NPDC004539]|uniref:hypothetical protein n=1 Tax=Streptomyces sp. NPDC004539 TaxID=3154280 RepID=UPI0033B153CE